MVPYKFSILCRIAIIAGQRPSREHSSQACFQMVQAFPRIISPIGSYVSHTEAKWWKYLRGNFDQGQLKSLEMNLNINYKDRKERTTCTKLLQKVIKKNITRGLFSSLCFCMTYIGPYRRNNSWKRLNHLKASLARMFSGWPFTNCLFLCGSEFQINKLCRNKSTYIMHWIFHFGITPVQRLNIHKEWQLIKGVLLWRLMQYVFTNI
jgi:hypothetical protein